MATTDGDKDETMSDRSVNRAIAIREVEYII